MSMRHSLLWHCLRIFEELAEFFSFYNSTILCIVKFSGHLLSDRDTTSSTGMGAGRNGNNQREWEGNGNETCLNLGLEMGMNYREWVGMGWKKTILLISNCEPYFSAQAGWASHNQPGRKCFSESLTRCILSRSARHVHSNGDVIILMADRKMCKMVNM